MEEKITLEQPTHPASLCPQPNTPPQRVADVADVAAPIRAVEETVVDVAVVAASRAHPVAGVRKTAVRLPPPGYHRHRRHPQTPRRCLCWDPVHGRGWVGGVVRGS